MRDIIRAALTDFDFEHRGADTNYRRPYSNLDMTSILKRTAIAYCIHSKLGTGPASGHGVDSFLDNRNLVRVNLRLG